MLAELLKQQETYHMAIEQDCSFCDVEALKDRTISTNEHAIAFLSTPRLMPGHVLVVPRRHIEVPSKLTSVETTAIFELIAPIHIKLLGSIALGVDIWQKSRPEVPEDGHKVDHIHFHVLPSISGDELYGEALNWRRANFTPLEDQERLTMLELLQDES